MLQAAGPHKNRVGKPLAVSQEAAEELARCCRRAQRAMPSPFPNSHGEEVFPAQFSSPCQTSRAAELFVQAGSGGSGAAARLT